MLRAEATLRAQEATLRAQEATLRAQEAKIGELTTKVEALTTEVTSLRAENQELRARLNRNSGNSSQPPSSDPEWTQRGAGPPPKGRSRGGQPGHKGHKREWLDADEIIEVKPSTCGWCGDSLAGADEEPRRHQVTDVPAEVRARVTEYQIHALSCRRCGHSTSGKLPDEVPRTTVGPRLQAILAVLTGAYRLSKRVAQEAVRDLFGVDISLGALSELEERTSQALAGVYEEAGEILAKSATVHVDETSWSKRNRAGWLWVCAANDVVQFRVREQRTASVAREFLEDYGGVAVTDGLPTYSFLPRERHQLCWAHVMRTFRGFRDLGPKAKGLSTKLLRVARKVFRLWYAVRDGTLSRASLPALIQPARDALHRLLQSGRWMPIKTVKGSCRYLVRRVESLWTFVDCAGVEPTNNHAERMLRGAVLWRKSSFGTNSRRGDRFAERILSTVQTLRLQRRNVLDFVTQACRAFLLANTPPPSLRPAHG